MAPPIDGFLPPVPVGDGTLTLPVYTSVLGEIPLIVLHELPGMTPSFVAFCRRMAGEGFRVRMPLMFHEAEAEMSTLQIAGFCLSREFRQLFSASQPGSSEPGSSQPGTSQPGTSQPGTSQPGSSQPGTSQPGTSQPGSSRAPDAARPLTRWLLHLVRVVAEEQPARRIGVVGMCLTGGFSLVALADPDVAGVVCCQPAYPFWFNIRSLGMTAAQRHAASRRAASLTAPCARGYRYRCDWICRRSHIRAIQSAFGPAFSMHPLLPGWGHSTVTGARPNEDVFRDMVAFLQQRL